MSRWPTVKAQRLLAALIRLGWTIKRQSGSHRTLQRPGWLDFVFAFHDRVGIRSSLKLARRCHKGGAEVTLSVSESGAKEEERPG
jgi:predicted RNA binding protein YcfA (HicA-like mRNA interferase family)